MTVPTEWELKDAAHTNPLRRVRVKGANATSTDYYKRAPHDFHTLVAVSVQKQLTAFLTKSSHQAVHKKRTHKAHHSHAHHHRNTYSSPSDTDVQRKASKLKREEGHKHKKRK